MGRGKLTEKEVQLLCKNPYVKAVSNDRIRYTEEFKGLFMQEYIEGKKGPTQIFREAGFDTKVLGDKRIERAAAHWRKSYGTGTLNTFSKVDNEKDSHEQQLNALKEENELLKEQIQLLRTMQNMYKNKAL